MFQAWDFDYAEHMGIKTAAAPAVHSEHKRGKAIDFCHVLSFLWL